jgi:hypothetical protein
MVRLRRHTGKSRQIWILAVGLIGAAVVWMDVGGGGLLSPLLVLAAMGCLRFGRRFQIEEVRPRPQNPDHKRWATTLQAAQIVAVAILAAVTFWFLFDPVDSAGHAKLRWIFYATTVVTLVIVFATGKAYRRLLDEVGSSEGAYGL